MNKYLRTPTTDDEFLQQKAQQIREKIKDAHMVFGIGYDHDNPDHQLVVAYSLGLNEWAQARAGRLEEEEMK